MTSREYEAVLDLPSHAAPIALIKAGPRVPLQVAKPHTSAAIEGKALLDTGAGHSAVAAEVAKQLGLRKVGETDVLHQGGVALLPVYTVHLYLEELGRIDVFNALGSPSIGRMGLVALLGRDALRSTVLSYDGPNGRFRLTLPEA